jgi:hypothetical protein
MQHKTFIALFAAGVLLTSVPAYALGVSLPAQPAAVGATASSTKKADKKLSAQEARIAKAQDRASQEIDRRTKALTELTSVIQGMRHLTDEQKNNFSANYAKIITSLNELKAKIAADTELATLKTDIQSITQSYRIFMLVIPQGRILAAAERIQAVAASEKEIATKLSTRIDEAAAGGKDVRDLKTILSDMQAKAAEAAELATAATSAVADLIPDEGDTTKAGANSQTIKDARAKIKTALKDVQTARADAHKIAKALIKTASSTTATSTQQ